MEKKAVNPVPFLIAAIVLLIVGLIYTGMTRPEPESALASSPTPTPTVTALVPKKREKTKLSSEEVKAVLEEAAELVTSKYYYTNAADFESVLPWFGTGVDNPFTRSTGYVTYDGVVSIGIDFSQITFEIDDDRNLITVNLPEEKILSHEISNDSVKANSKESVFNTLDAEYYAKLIGGLKETTEKKILGNADYMKEVRRNTRQIIRNFFAASESTAKFTIEFSE